MPDLLTLDDFRPLVGLTFVLDYPDYREALTLVSAVPSRFEPRHGLPRGFDLEFEGESATTMLGQAVYRLKNAALGEVDLFLSCIGPRADGGFRYQANFN